MTFIPEGNWHIPAKEFEMMIIIMVMYLLGLLYCLQCQFTQRKPNVHLFKCRSEYTMNKYYAFPNTNLSTSQCGKKSNFWLRITKIRKIAFNFLTRFIRNLGLVPFSNLRKFKFCPLKGLNVTLQVLWNTLYHMETL